MTQDTVPAIDIDTRERATIERLLHRYLPGIEVWAYGSRVRWNARPQSDLDLVAFAPPQQRAVVLQLREAFEESSLPFSVDLLIWDDLPESFHRNIEAGYVVLQSAREENVNSEWREFRLGEIAEIFDGPHATPKKTEDGPVFLGISNLVNGRIDFSTAEHLSDSDYATWTKRVIPQPGDIAFSYETRLGEAAAIPSGLQCCLGRRMGLLRVRKELVDPQFLLYAYLGPEFQGTLQSRTVQGSTVDRILLTELGAFPIRIPPLPKQRAIAHILGTLDDKIELNRRMNQTLEEMARGIFQDWFVDFGPVRAKLGGRELYLPPELWGLFPDRLVDSELGEIPEGWEVKALDQFADLNPRELMKKGTASPYLDMAALPTSGPSPDDAVLREFTSGTRFRNGDTLLARITPCLENGKTAFIRFLPENTVGWGSTEFIVMRAILPVPTEYPYLLARDGAFREHAIQSMTGTSGRQRVQVDALAPYLLPFPTTDVWAKFSSLISPLFDTIGSNSIESRSLAAQRDTLLPKLVSGEVKVGV